MPVKIQKPLTPRQKKVLDFISKFIEEKDYAPSLEEIANHFRKSVSTAQHHVDELERRGYLRKESNGARSITPISDNSGKIFLLGYISAGKPIEPIENPEPIEVPLSMMHSRGEYYALKVQGDSMIEDGIMDGDTIVVKHQKTAENGDTVVAMTESGATLKVFRNRNGRVYLEPKNKKLKIIFPNKLEIRGKFSGLLRK